MTKEVKSDSLRLVRKWWIMLAVISEGQVAGGRLRW